MRKFTVIVILFSILLSHDIAEGSYRSFKFGSSVHLSESFKPKVILLDEKTIDNSESSLPVKVSIAKEFSSLSVRSRLLSGTPANSNDDSSSSDGSNVIVFVVCAVLLAVLVIGLLLYIYYNRRSGRDVVYNATTQAKSTTKKNALPPMPVPVPAPVHAVSNHPPVIPKASPRSGAATVTDHPSAAAPIVKTPKDGRKPDGATEFRVISSNEFARRDNAAAAARVSYPGTSKPRSLRGAEFGLILFSYEDLQHATSNFSTANILGEGGFAKVYKGRLSDNTIVAVKELKSENTKGDREFSNEVKTISLAKHKNIVRLVGYCITDFSRCIVYEYVENKTLHDHIEGGEGIKTMEWAIRMKIATDAAKGIAYLHEDCPDRIIHRDIKPANILLDDKFVAKVADFGIAKLCPDHFKSHIASYVIGSFGFIDPAYWETRELTFKSDVYSFGVVLLQLVSAETHLPTLYQLRMEQLPRALESGNFLNIADPRLNSIYVRDEMALILTCAEACLRKDPKDRPPMIQVSRVLERLISASELKIKNIRRQGV